MQNCRLAAEGHFCQADAEDCTTDHCLSEHWENTHVKMNNKVGVFLSLHKYVSQHHGSRHMGTADEFTLASQADILLHQRKSFQDMLNWGPFNLNMLLMFQDTLIFTDAFWTENYLAQGYQKKCRKLSYMQSSTRLHPPQYFLKSSKYLPRDKEQRFHCQFTKRHIWTPTNPVSRGGAQPRSLHTESSLMILNRNGLSPF